jgi:hypothetical protein
MNQTTDVLEDYAGLEALANRALQESTFAHEYFESAIHRNDRSNGRVSENAYCEAACGS